MNGAAAVKTVKPRTRVGLGSPRLPARVHLPANSHIQVTAAAKLQRAVGGEPASAGNRQDQSLAARIKVTGRRYRAISAWRDIAGITSGSHAEIAASQSAETGEADQIGSISSAPRT